MSELAMTVTAARGLTVEEFWALPEPPVGERHQLIDGEVVVAAAPIPKHQRAVLHLTRLLHDQLVETGAMVYPSPLDVLLGERTVVQPDVVVYDGSASIDQDAVIEALPVIVVEVLSPSSIRTDLMAKRRRYEQAAIPEYWIVDVEDRTVDVLRLADGHYTEMDELEVGDTITSSTFPEIAIDVGEVCEDWTAEGR